MANYDFEVKVNSFRIDETDMQTVVGDAIETWLDGLNIDTSKTIRNLSIVKHQGFVHVIIIYDA